MLNLRDLRQSAQFASDLDALDSDVRRADDALRYVNTLLARDPTSGFPARTAPGIWLAPLVFDVDGETVLADIAYAFDDKVVDLLAIARVDFSAKYFRP